MNDPIRIEISPGELIDRITILQIKARRIENRAQRANVTRELALLTEARDRALTRSERLENLTATLLEINETLWEIEDDIRACEAQGQFDSGFIGLARAVYHTNDQRAAAKREINLLLDSPLIEEKSYTAY